MATFTRKQMADWEKTQSDKYWKLGRLVVHTVGEEAGLMRLDIELAGVGTVDDVEHHVHLTIPGETSALEPCGVAGEDRRFVISFFSSDVANAGHLPAEAVVSWTSPDQKTYSHPVRIESAEMVASVEGHEAVDIPGGEPVIVYPKAVALMVLLALLAGIAAVIGLLATW